MFSFRLLRVVSFANLLTGNKLRCKIFRGLTGHAFEGYSLAIVQLVLNRHPRQALRGVLSKALLLCVAIMLLFCLEYKISVTCHNVNRVFLLTWPASMQIDWNKRMCLHKKRVQLPKDWFGTPTWPPFHCFGTPICPP